MAKHQLITLTIALISLDAVFAFSTFPALIPNGASFSEFDAIGHVNPAGGGARNEFGAAFGAAGTTFTKEFCEADSDEDGVSNGAELGDPCCVWTTTNTDELITEGISHPGLADDTTTSAALTSPNCEDLTTTAPDAGDSSAANVVTGFTTAVAALFALTVGFFFTA